MTGTSLNLHLSDLLRDWNAKQYGYAERLGAINTAITQVHQELIRTENYLARKYVTNSLTTNYAYHDLPSDFYQHWEGGAFIGDRSDPLVLTDARDRITFGDSRRGVPTHYWLEQNDDGTIRMQFDCSPYNSQTLHLEYFITPPVWTKTGKNPADNTDALDIIGDNSGPYGGLFDYGILFLAASRLIGRNNFKSRDSYEGWAQDALASAMSVAHKGNLAMLKSRPIHGHKVEYKWYYSSGGSRTPPVTSAVYVFGMGGGVFGLGGGVWGVSG